MEKVVPIMPGTNDNRINEQFSLEFINWHIKFPSKSR